MTFALVAVDCVTHGAVAVARDVTERISQEGLANQKPPAQDDGDPPWLVWPCLTEIKASARKTRCSNAARIEAQGRELGEKG
jgi:hypothetical protein